MLVVVQAKSAGELDAVESIKQSIVGETLPGEISAHFGSVEDCGKVGMDINYFDPLGTAKDVKQLHDGRPICASVHAIQPGGQAATHPAIERGLVLTHIEGEPLVGMDPMDVQDILLGARRYIMVPKESDRFKAFQERCIARSAAAGSNAAYMQRALAQSEAEQETEKQRAARFTRLQHTHNDTVGCLEKLHGVMAEPGSREERLRTVAQLMKDTALAREEHIMHKRRKTATNREDAGPQREDSKEPDDPRCQKVVALCRQLVSEYQEWDEAHYYLGFALGNMLDEWDEANGEYRVVIRLNPEHGPAKYALAGAERCLRQQREEDAQQMRERHLEVVRAVCSELAIGAPVVLVGIKSQPELNGKTGVVEGVDAEKGRYTIAVDGDKKRKNLKPANLVTPDKSKVTEEAGESSAAELKSAGNDAFGTKDWDRALQLYSQSVRLDGKSQVAAKTWSNLAATLCKLSYFDEALKAAEQGTICDPQWGKAWWRRGVVLSLVREFAYAAKCYERACVLEPSNGTFAQAARDARKVLGIGEAKDEKGMRKMSLDQAPGVVYRKTDEIKGGPMAAWKKATEHAGGLQGWAVSTRAKEVQFLASTGADVDPREFSAEDLIGICSSESWIVGGLIEWVQGLQGGLCQLFLAGVSPAQAGRDAALRYRELVASGNFSQEEMKRFEAENFGGFSGDAVPQLFCGWVTLAGGGMLWLETGTVASPSNILLPAHPMLNGFAQERHQQMLAITISIANLHATIQQIWAAKTGSNNVLMPAAVQVAVDTWMTNMGNAQHKDSETVTVEAAVTYLKKQLHAGISWDDGCRQLVSCWFRGSVLFSQLIRLQGLGGEAYKMLSWALEMIEAVDEEFQVTAKKRFNECGSAFVPSIRRSVLQGVGTSSYATARLVTTHAPIAFNSLVAACALYGYCHYVHLLLFVRPCHSLTNHL